MQTVPRNDKDFNRERIYRTALRLLRAERALDHAWTAPSSLWLDWALVTFEAATGVTGAA